MRTVSDKPEDDYAKGHTHQEWVKKVNKIVRWIKRNSSNIKSTERAIAQADENLKSGKPVRRWGKLKSGNMKNIKKLDTDNDDYPKILGYTHPDSGESVMITVQTVDDMDDILGPLLRQYPNLPYSID